MVLLISVNYAKRGFCDWVMFRDEPIKYLDKNLVLGRYLGWAIYVGPAKTDKIMKGNVEVVHRSTYRGLK